MEIRGLLCNVNEDFNFEVVYDRYDNTVVCFLGVVQEEGFGG